MAKASLFILEDDRLQRESLALQLIDAGYQIAGTAESAEEALPHIADNHPDVLLVDIELAGVKDGVRFTEELSARSAPRIPVIYTTRFRDEATLKRAQKSLPFAYLAKPFNILELCIAIESAIRLAVDQRESTLSQSPYLLNDSVFIKQEHVFHRIAISDLILVQAQRQYSLLLTTGKSYLVSSNLETVHRQLDHPDLVRAHRSFVVNVNSIEAITGNLLTITVPNSINLPEAIASLGNRVPIGEYYKSALVSRLRSL